MQFEMASSTGEMGSISGGVGISQKSIVYTRGISTNRNEDVLDFASIRPASRGVHSGKGAEMGGGGLGLLPWEKWLPPYVFGPLLCIGSILILVFVPADRFAQRLSWVQLSSRACGG